MTMDSSLHTEWGTARDRRRRPSGRRWIPLLFFLAVGALAGVVFFDLLVMPWFVRHGNETEVPDLRGMTVEESATVLAKAGLKTGTVQEAFHDRVAQGRIVRHSPPPGFRVKQGRAVDIVVSLGHQAVRVPEVEGENLVHARFLLSQAGLQAGEIRTIRSGEVPEGQVIASDPRPGTELAGRTSVDLLVSQGPSARLLVMPDVRGEDADEAAAYLEAAGFRVKRRFWPGSRSEWPRVSDQTPLPGYPVEEGGEVELVIGE